MSNIELIKVRGNGNCFFYALYQALQNKNLLDLFVTTYLPNNNNDEDAFANNLRNYLSTNNDFRVEYMNLIKTYCSLRADTINELVQLNNIPPNGVNDFIQSNEDKIKEAFLNILSGLPQQVQNIITDRIGGNNSNDYQNNCNNDSLKQEVLNNILDELIKKTFWAAELEVEFIKNLLDKINIKLAVVYSTVDINIESLISQPRTIVLINDNESHYDWLKPTTNIDTRLHSNVNILSPIIEYKNLSAKNVNIEKTLLAPLNRKYTENTINNDHVNLYDFEPYWDETKEPSTINHTLFSILNPYNAPYVNFDEKLDDLFDSSPEDTTNKFKGGSNELEKITEKIEKFIIKSINIDDYGCDTNNELFLKDIVKNMEPTKLKNIYEVNFVKDMKMVSKFVYYRLLEIKKQIRLINYAIETYKKIIVYIKWYENNTVNNVSVNRLSTYKAKQKILEKILEDNIINNEQAFIKNLLCRYVSLKYILNKIQTNSLDKMTETTYYKNSNEKEDEDEYNKQQFDSWTIFFILAIISPQNKMDDLIFVNKK